MSKNHHSTVQDGRAITRKSTFSRETSITTSITADPAIVWALLTNAADYPRWNSTIVSIDGEIEEGSEISLKSTLDESRTFKLKVKELVPEERLVWGDRMGSRIYTLSKQGEDVVIFSMTEEIGGLLFPLFAGQIPSFDASFEQFAADLKREAETIQKAQQ
ncbi:MAG: SRPBCC domain-containing protein [Candidatus Promineifilaceae bacterium]|nr:SRPBCC domain-containing protein [Candidatus Promineifilaceae bacterium]